MNESKIKTIGWWFILFGVGVLGLYWGIPMFAQQRDVVLQAISEGDLKTGLQGLPLTIVLTLRSAVVYAAAAWIVWGVGGLIRRRTPQETAAKGWTWALATGVLVKLVGEFFLNPSLFTEIMVGGLQKGFIYALIALGYTMVYGVVRLINFAHGDFFMIGAFVSFYTISSFKMHQWPGALYVRLTGASSAPGWTLAIGVLLIILISMAASSFLAIVVERVAYKPLRNAPRIAALITAVGVSFFLEYFSALDFGFGPDYVTYNRPFDLVRWNNANLNIPLLVVYLILLVLGVAGQALIWYLTRKNQNGPVHPLAQNVFLRLGVRFGLLAGGVGSLYMGLTLAGIGITNIQVLVMTASVFLLVTLQYIVNQTKIGKAMRASAWDKQTARLMGINVDQVISFTFALGASLAGAASVLYAVAYPQLIVFMGIMPGLRAFVSAVLGGIGSIPGAFLGALIMGQAEELSAAFISTPMRDAIAFTILILVLIIRPTGIFGEAGGEKA